MGPRSIVRLAGAKMPRRVTIADIRRAGFCATGARRLIESYGFNFADFMKNGMAEKDFLASGDAFAQRVIARTRADG